MGKETTISISQSTKDELEIGKTQPWDPYLLDLKRNETETVQLSEEQIDYLARKSAAYVLGALTVDPEE